MRDIPELSANPKRNKIYASYLKECQKGNITLEDLIQMGSQLMSQSKLHPHFFMDNSFSSIAQYLAFFALHFPMEEEQRLETILTADEAQKIIRFFEKRIAEKIPVEYITHEAFYLGHRFYVNENVLVPRSIMNTRFADFLKEMHWENYHVLDLCTGSGCIGISLALLQPNIHVDLSDISPKALEVAQINVDHYSLNERIRCIESNLFENIQDKYDLIITNPPYVSMREYEASPDEFKKEPKIALESGKDGLNIIHQILRQTKHYLNPQGKLIAEVGYTAAKRIKKHYPKIAFKWYKYRRPNGKESFFGMHGIFECAAKDLPDK